MRILHIIPSLRKGGAERLVLDICTRLNQIPEVEVKLVCFSDKNDYPEISISDFIKIIPSYIQISIYKKNKLQIESLQDFINEFRPDVIHTHLFEAEIVSRSIYYPLAKWVSHCHDNMRQFENFSIKTIFSKQRITNYYEKNFLFRRYEKNGWTQFIAIGNDTKKYFEKTAKQYPVIKLLNAIDINRFYKQKKFSHRTQIRITNTGSFVNKKNQAFILDIALELKLKNIDFKINFLGDGPNKLILLEKSKQLGLENNLSFHGNVNNVEEFLWNSDIYLHTATYEPLGLVLIEAMASGLPVITLDGKGNRDLIEEGRNGYMIYEQNPQLFADKIIAVWNDKPKYAEMSKYAQEYAKQYDIKPYVEKLLALYQEAIDEKQ